MKTTIYRIPNGQRAWLGVLLGGVLCATQLYALATRYAWDESGFTLTDYLGRTWRNECVVFPIDKTQWKAANSGRALVGSDGKPVLYQILPGASKDDPRSIAFLADLDPFETRAYRFTNSTAKAQSDLKIEETDDFIRISTASTGISLRKKLASGSAPIEGIRLKSGKWIGASRLVSTNHPLSSYTAEIAARGPVFAEVVCRATFAATNQWVMRFRVPARDPVVLVDETCSLQDDSQLVLSLSENFTPDSLLYRVGRHPLPGSALALRGVPFGAYDTWKFSANKTGPVFVLEPWLHWWENERQGVWFGLYNESGADLSSVSRDLLAIGAREAGTWVDPSVAAAKRSPARIDLMRTERGLEMRFPLRLGQRKWLIATVDKDACLAGMKDEKAALEAPLPQQYLIKHGDFPLNVVKDYVLQWKVDHTKYPNLFLTKADVEKFRLSVTNSAGNELKTYLITGNAELGRKIINGISLQGYVDGYVKRGTLSSAPSISSPSVLFVADLMLNSPQLTPAERERILAQAAFLGYTLDRPDNWSPERGFSANPNMTTQIRASKVMVACFIPSHPQAKRWVKDGLDELKSQIDNWADANGGWLEAPHYATVSYDALLGTFLMAHNAGFGDHLYHPNMRKVIEWLGKISTPPDSRIKGWRHLPPIGNTWSQEPCGEFGVVAHLWKDRDPAFAAQMQWMWRQHGSYPHPGIGGAYPALDAVRTFLYDESIPDKAPAWKSELFPEMGVILRNKFPSPRETQLHMIAGNHHAHYDMDSGSITVWGKGRIMADEFGYYGHIPAEEHSMITSPLAGGTMKITTFAPSDALDYIKGVMAGWTRQIAFVKDADPLGANYFVLCDSIAAATNATWRLWMTANKITPTQNGAAMEGKEDVDMDIFFARPSPVTLKTEELTRAVGCGMNTNGNPRPMSSTQIGLIVAVAPETYSKEHVVAKAEPVPYFVTVLYPRLKTEKAPVLSSIASGKGVKVESTSGTDYVFLSPYRFLFKEGEIFFEGTAGAVHRRGKSLILSLGAAGSISVGEQTLKADKPATRSIP
ncbi:MAG: hypothetical protein HYV36_01325 [Lentisphaerae bacterium]|nr:hypothetical protein [Lentisphaerota bacterium]